MRKFSFYISSFFQLFLVLKNRKLRQTGFQFLSVTSDARSGGMADAMTTMHDKSTSLFSNPAGLSKQTERFDVNFSFKQLDCRNQTRCI